MATKKPYHLAIEQGATFRTTVVWNDANSAPIDLTDYTARMHIRSAYTANVATESLTSANGEITIIADEGTLVLNLSATRTAAIPVNTAVTTSQPPKQTYVYDLEAVAPDGTVTRLLYGNCIVSAEVTK